MYVWPKPALEDSGQAFLAENDFDQIAQAKKQGLGGIGRPAISGRIGGGIMLFRDSGP